MDQNAAGPVGTRTLQGRILGATVVLFLIGIAVAAVLVAATQVRAALDLLDGVWADLYVVLGLLLTMAHLNLVLLARVGRMIEVRHRLWSLMPVHLVWGSGVLVGIPMAAPIGVGLVLFDVMLLYWLKDVDQTSQT